jgi:FkbM family methyltransferase
MRLQPGLKIRLYGDSELCRLIYCRHFEATERAFLNHFLRPGDVFVDVGANIGLFTLIAACSVGPAGRVIAFEPTSVTYARLVDNVRLKGFSNVRCVNSALSDRSGYLDLTQSTDGFDAWNSFAEPTMGTTNSRERVEVIEWDHYARDHHCYQAEEMLGKSRTCRRKGGNCSARRTGVAGRVYGAIGQGRWFFVP